MAVHDWTRVEAGTFHHFHITWIAQLSSALNGGLLPSGYYALAEQHTGDVLPDVLTLHASSSDRERKPSPGGSVGTVTKNRPRVDLRLVARAFPKGKRRSIAVRHVSGHRIITLLEIVLLANKDRRRSVPSFVNKVVTALRLGIHVSLIDLYPPGIHDPGGMHGAVWDRFDPDQAYALPSEQSLSLAAYAAGTPPGAYVDHLSVGDPLPGMPLFLTARQYIELPLEPTYAAAYQGVPEFWREVIEGRRRPA